MSSDLLLQRRELLAGLAGVGAVLGTLNAGAANAAMPAAAPVSAQRQAVIDATADCQRAGRACLAACTNHLAAGMDHMADCQRAVMNMLAVVGAMGDVAGYGNAAPADMQTLATACATFCDRCAAACEPHAGHHAECKACHEACVACAKACRALTA